MNDVDRIGVIGSGKWGRYLVRNFSEILGESNVTVCDPDPEKLEEVKRNHREVDTTESFDAVLDNKSIPAVIVATPASSHHELTKEALQAKKHVLVEDRWP